LAGPSRTTRPRNRTQAFRPQKYTHQYENYKWPLTQACDITLAYLLEALNHRRIGKQRSIENKGWIGGRRVERPSRVGHTRLGESDPLRRDDTSELILVIVELARKHATTRSGLKDERQLGCVVDANALDATRRLVRKSVAVHLGSVLGEGPSDRTRSTLKVQITYNDRPMSAN